MVAPFPMSEHLPNFESFHLPLLPPDRLPEVAAALPAAPVPCKAWPWAPAPRGSLLAWGMWLPPLSHTLSPQQHHREHKFVPWVPQQRRQNPNLSVSAQTHPHPLAVPTLSWGTPVPHPPEPQRALSQAGERRPLCSRDRGRPLAPPKAAKDQAGCREGRAEVALRWQE